MITLEQGDCLELMKKIPTGSVDMILTDLPYGTTRNKWDSVINMDKVWQEYKRVIKENGAIALFGAEPFASKLRTGNAKMYRYDWIWQKTAAVGFLNASRMPLRSYENVCIFYKRLPTYHPQMRTGFKPYTKTKSNPSTTNYGSAKPWYSESKDGKRFPLDVITFSKDKQRIHPTQKPVALLEYLIKTYTDEGQTVLDSTMGSGSTGVACVNTNRNFIGYELNDKYFEIAKDRIYQATEDKEVA